jgi:hypothetical protein
MQRCIRLFCALSIIKFGGGGKEGKYNDLHFLHVGSLSWDNTILIGGKLLAMHARSQTHSKSHFFLSL